MGGSHRLFLSKQTEITAGNSKGSFDQRSQRDVDYYIQLPHPFEYWVLSANKYNQRRSLRYWYQLWSLIDFLFCVEGNFCKLCWTECPAERCLSCKEVVEYGVLDSLLVLMKMNWKRIFSTPSSLLDWNYGDISKTKNKASLVQSVLLLRAFSLLSPA